MDLARPGASVCSGWGCTVCILCDCVKCRLMCYFLCSKLFCNSILYACSQTPTAALQHQLQYFCYFFPLHFAKWHLGCGWGSDCILRLSLVTLWIISLRVEMYYKDVFLLGQVQSLFSFTQNHSKPHFCQDSWTSFEPSLVTLKFQVENCVKLRSYCMSISCFERL